MWTYSLLNMLFMVVILGVLFRFRSRVKWRAAVIVLAVLLVMTAIFDSYIIYVSIVSYDAETLLGVYVGRAPIEDFSYAIIAAIGMPLLWEGLGKHE